MNELEDNLNDFINGSISFLTYRDRRTGFINRFVDSGYLPDDTIPLNNTEQQHLKKTINEKIKQEKRLKASDLDIHLNNSPRVTSKQYIILGILIITAASTWYYSTTTPTSDNVSIKKETSGITEAQTTKSTETTNKSIEQKFIINFLKMDQWNSETLSDFLVKWQALSRLDKKEIKQTQSFIRLKNSLRLRILEQRALQATQKKAAERQENLLVWFASQLSITIN